MQFPVVFDIAGSHVPAHLVFETAAYAVGFAVWRISRRRGIGPALSRDQSLWVLVGAAVGAALGAKLLGFLEWFGELQPRVHEPQAWLEMKTIVGALLGGWIGVEVAKRLSGIRCSTGDAMVFGLVAAIAVGRIGCFLTGVEDRTVGVHTDLPWAVDFGDGPRHPAPLYEIAFLVLLGAVLWSMRNRLAPGALFRWFLLGYLAFRFGVDFLKPRLTPLAGLSAIQVGCLGGTAFAAFSLIRLRRVEAPDGRPAVQVP
jgi:prolipoprotein diacylglyceryltransferase